MPTRPETQAGPPTHAQHREMTLYQWLTFIAILGAMLLISWLTDYRKF
jgi:hypothetical protein